MSEKQHVLYMDEFPRSNKYDPDWVMDNQMGPNALCLIEYLAEKMDLKPGMKVLDLGCGKAMTSVFLAREFDVEVFAADLWIHQDENWGRIVDAGVSDRVVPMRFEAHALPFAKNFFDAIVSLDAYQYFGTDELFLGYLTHFLKDGGKIGVVVPALMKEFDQGIPDHLTREQKNGKAFWEDDCICFKTLDWWRSLWERSNRVDIIAADILPDGWKMWRDFETAITEAGKNIFPSVAEALDNDGGEYIGFVRMLASRKPGVMTMNMYDSSLISTMSE